MSEEQTLIRSEAITKILDEKPSKLMRWGTLFILFVITAIIVASWYIKYPDIVNSDVVITDATPPVPVTSRIQGLIEDIFVTEGDVVAKGSTLAVIKNEADFEDVKEIEKTLEMFEPYNSNTFFLFDSLDTSGASGIELGEIRPAFNFLLNSIKEYKIGFESPDSKITSIQKRINSLNRIINEEKKKIPLLKEQIRAQDQMKDIEHERMKNNSKLTSDKLEEIVSKKVEMEQDVFSYEASIEAKKLEINDLQSQIISSRQLNTRTSALSFENIDEKKKYLETQIEKWKQQYLLEAPASGVVSFYDKRVSEKRFFQKDEKIMAILPEKTEEIIGKVALDVRHNGKVNEEQNVLIKLSSYPYQEFGKIRGKVRYKADIAKDNLVALEVELTNGLTTTNGKEIPQEQQLTGIAEIITEEKRLFQRIYEKVF